MTKRFCDVCGSEIKTNVVSERLKFEAVLRHRNTPTFVNVEIVCGIGKGAWNSGDLCRSCLFNALDTKDPRPKAAEPVAA